MNVWHFREGTGERIGVPVVTHRAIDWGRDSVALAPSENRYILTCPMCGDNFTLRPDDHKVTVGTDGALSAEHSFNCPRCMNWHRHIRGGVVQP